MTRGPGRPAPRRWPALYGPSTPSVVKQWAPGVVNYDALDLLSRPHHPHKKSPRAGTKLPPLKKPDDGASPRAAKPPRNSDSSSLSPRAEDPRGGSPGRQPDPQATPDAAWEDLRRLGDPPPRSKPKPRVRMPYRTPRKEKREKRKREREADHGFDPTGVPPDLPTSASSGARSKDTPQKEDKTEDGGVKISVALDERPALGARMQLLRQAFPDVDKGVLATALVLASFHVGVARQWVARAEKPTTPLQALSVWLGCSEAHMAQLLARHGNQLRDAVGQLPAHDPPALVREEHAAAALEQVHAASSRPTAAGAFPAGAFLSSAPASQKLMRRVAEAEAAGCSWGEISAAQFAPPRRLDGSTAKLASPALPSAAGARAKGDREPKAEPAPDGPDAAAGPRTEKKAPQAPPKPRPERGQVRPPAGAPSGGRPKGVERDPSGAPSGGRPRGVERDPSGAPSGGRPRGVERDPSGQQQINPRLKALTRSVVGGWLDAACDQALGLRPPAHARPEARPRPERPTGMGLVDGLLFDAYTQAVQSEAAAVRIQASFRGKADRKEVEALKEERREQTAAATKIQAKHRGKAARKEAAQKRQERQEEDAAATKIQARYKGKKARKKLKEQRDPQGDPAGDSLVDLRPNEFSYEQEYCATVIQATFRGKQTRKSLAASASQVPLDRRVAQTLIVAALCAWSGAAMPGKAEGDEGYGDDDDFEADDFEDASSDDSVG